MREKNKLAALNISSSSLVLLLISATYISSLFYYHKWSDGSSVPGGDPFGYYCYLPAIFIHNDLSHLRYSAYARDAEKGISRDSSQPVKDIEVYFSGSTPIIKYTCGVAILESPAFFIAHIFALATHSNANGYSPVYIFVFNLWNTLFVFFGLLLLKKVLRSFFPDGIVALVLLAIGIGTNLFYFSVYNLGMSHSYLFTLYAGLMLFTIRFHKAPDIFNAFFLGLFAGLITLIRPNEIICVLIPLLYGINSVSSFRDKILRFIKRKELYLAVGMFALCGLPQLLYWKLLSGHWVYYSYGSESFDFTTPHIYQGLFGFKNGLFPYAPIILLTVPGIILMLFKRQPFTMALLTFIPAQVYIIYSWWCWQYINGLGSRPMVETYPLLAIPLAFTFHVLYNNKVAKVALFIVVAVVCCQQLLLTYQASRNIMWSEDSTQAYYMQTLFKYKIDINDLYAYDLNEVQPKNVAFDHLITKADFEDSISANYLRNYCGTGNFSFLLDNHAMYLTILDSTAGACGLKPGNWLKVSFDACNGIPQASLYQYAAMVVEYKRNGESYCYKSVRIQNKIPNQEPFGVWRFNYDGKGRIAYFVSVPPQVQAGDEVLVYGSNTSSSIAFIDNVSIEAYKAYRRN